MKDSLAIIRASSPRLAPVRRIIANSSCRDAMTCLMAVIMRTPLMAIASPANKVRMLRMPGNCVATSSVEKPATCTLVMSENP